MWDPKFRGANATLEKEDNMLRDAIFQAARRGMPLVAPEEPAVPPGKNNQSAGFAVKGISSMLSYLSSFSLSLFSLCFIFQVKVFFPVLVGTWGGGGGKGQIPKTQQKIFSVL